MTEIIETIKSNCYMYTALVIHVALYWMALVWISLYGKDRKKNNLYWYAIWSMLAVLGLSVAVKIVTGANLPFKTFLILPTGVLIAYVGVELSDVLRAESLVKKKWIIILLYVIIIQAATGLKYEMNYLGGTPNVYRISTSVIRIDEYVCREKQPFLLAPSWIAAQIQEYDTKVRVAYGEGYTYTTGDMDALMEEAERYGCNCLLIDSEAVDMEYMEECGYRLIAILEGYHLYGR